MLETTHPDGEAVMVCRRGSNSRADAAGGAGRWRREGARRGEALGHLLETAARRGSKAGLLLWTHSAQQGRGRGPGKKTAGYSRACDS